MNPGWTAALFGCLLMINIQTAAAESSAVDAITGGASDDVPVLLQINGARKTPSVSETESASQTRSVSRTESGSQTGTAFQTESVSQTRSVPPAQTATSALGTRSLSATPHALPEQIEKVESKGDDSEPRKIAQRVPITIGDYGLSTVTVAMVNAWGIGPYIKNLDESYKQWQATKTSDDAIQYLIHKQKLTETLADLGFDVRRCTNAVDREIARNASRAAYLTELRDKAIRYNTYADFVAGGLTGIISGALEMSNLTRFASNSVDIAEGVGQSTLSYWAWRAEHAGDRSQGPVPNVLASIVDPSIEHKAYTESVSAFLNTAPPDSNGRTRADMMRERWDKLNFCFTHPSKGHKMKKNHRVKHLTGQHQEDATMTIDLLEDRTAMLQDLRAEITTMDESLAELFDLLHKY